jgi:hypothetical protein
MSRPDFTNKHRTFGKWLKAMPRDSKYAKEIIRKHQLFPDKSLSQLRNLKVSDYDLSRVAWQNLTSQQKADRNLSLSVLREVRKGESLTQVLEKRGLKREFVLKNLGNQIQKSNGKWFATKTDSLQTEIRFNSKNGVRTIVTTSSKDRSRIAKYFNDVQKALKKNDASVLQKYKSMKVIDAEGKVHQFETDLDKLYDIAEAQEEPEFQEFYLS